MFTGEEMRDDVPDQPGRCGASLTNAVRVGLILVIMIVLEGLARAQSGMDVSDVSPISLHPGVPTIVQMPDEIEHTWVFHSGEFMVQGVRDKLYLRPRPGTRAGVEGLVEVKAGTLHQVFWLRVVKRVEDAQREVVVPPVVAAKCAEPAASAAPAAESAASVSGGAPEPSEPSAPEPAEPKGAITAEPGGTAAAADDERDAATDGERDAPAAGSPRFVISVHAVAALVGTTGVTVAGYEAIDARQPHRAFGMRVAVTPPDAWWSVEASVSGEQLVAPTSARQG